MKHLNFAHVIRLAGAFVACTIGSGFATGQEIIQFFAAQGTCSIYGTLITTIVFSCCGALFMKHGFKHNLSSPQIIIEFYFGKTIGKYVELLIQVFLFGVYGIMIAGAGATIQEFMGISPLFGRIIMSILVLITVILGLSRLTDILGGIGPVIIAFTLITGIVAIINAPSDMDVISSILKSQNVIKTSGGWFWSSILYPGFNSIVVIFLCCSIGQTSDCEEEAIAGGIVGGILFGIAIIIMNLALSLNFCDIVDVSVPTLVLARKIGSLFASIFTVVICCGIYTTAAPMLWGCVRHFAEDGTKKSFVLAIVLCGLGFLLGLTEFKTLVNIIYPFSGYFGILLLLIVGYREILDRKASVYLSE